MRELLKKINKAVHDAGGTLDKTRAEDYRKRYRKILENGEPECPAPKRKEGQKGRLKNRNHAICLNGYKIMKMIHCDSWKITLRHLPIILVKTICV